jgi:hypothetical protein
MENPPAEVKGDEHTDDMFGAIDYVAPKPQKKTFLAWHKPRKQFVRQFQWCKEIEALLENSQPEGNILKYLGLPGDDLLDLRYFHSKICEPRQMQLRFLGFNSSANPKSSAQTELNISLDEVRKLPGIDPLSDVIWDDFRLVGNDNEKAWDRAKGLGPYDIINIDLCDGFAKPEPGMLDNSYYKAVNQLMSLQARKKDPWLLFLTTRTRKSDVHVELMQRLLDKYAQNLANCPSFKLASSEMLAIKDNDTLNSAADTPEGHLSILLVGLCKWLLGLAVAQNPPSKIDVKGVIGYRVYAGAPHDDLISIAFKFEPTFVPVNDPMGIANHSKIAPGECEQATDALKQVQQRSSADEAIADDLELRGQLVKAMADLLRLARYDVDAYHAWLLAN